MEKAINLITITAIFLIVLFLCLLTSCASTPKWDTGDRIAGGTLIAGQAGNAFQMIALHEKEKDGWHEINGLLPDLGGKTEIYAWKAVTSGAVLWIADLLPSKWRKRLLWGANTVVWSFFMNDIEAGVGFRF